MIASLSRNQKVQSDYRFRKSVIKIVEYKLLMKKVSYKISRDFEILTIEIVSKDANC
jgi:hypothetical protein